MRVHVDGMPVSQRLEQLEGHVIESIVVSITISRLSRRLVLVGAYRPPNLTNASWITDMQETLQKAVNLSDNIMRLIGDLNCDLIRSDNDQAHGRVLLDISDLYGLKCRIIEPTRITSTMSTLLDVILISKSRSFLASGLCNPDLSDHHLKTTETNFTVRSFRTFDETAYVKNLELVPFHVANDVNYRNTAQNEFFVNIANQDHSKAETTKEPSIEDYKDHPSIMAINDNFTFDRIFNFEPTSPGQVMNIIQTWDVSKATGQDSIPVRALRYGAPALHYTLSSLFNVILQKGKLPSVWKEGEIAPVFKKGDQFYKTNFRPLTILIAIDKVFENCLHWELLPLFWRNIKRVPVSVQKTLQLFYGTLTSHRRLEKRT